MPPYRPEPSGRGRRIHVLRAVLCCAALFAAAPSRAGDERTLSFFNTHTDETITVTFKRDGRFVPEALEQLNRFLRDWRRNEATRMDPQLFDLIWEVHRQVGSQAPVHIVCGYRAPATNEMLRSRSRGVAKFSQHTLGKAIDLRFPDVPISRVREMAMKMQVGGVGFYPGSSFVHMDTGNVRAWPRMTREQLVRLFPDGKTAHLPADGHPLPGHDEAVAEVLRRKASGQTVMASSGWSGFFGLFTRSNHSAASAPAPSGRTVVASRDEEEDEAAQAPAKAAPSQAAQAPARPASETTQAPREPAAGSRTAAAEMPPVLPLPRPNLPRAAEAPTALAALPKAKPSELVQSVAQQTAGVPAILPAAKPSLASGIPPVLAKLDGQLPAAASAYASLDGGNATPKPPVRAMPRAAREAPPLRYDNRALHLLMVEASLSRGETISRLSPPRIDEALMRAPDAVVHETFRPRRVTLRTDAFQGSATARVPTLTPAPQFAESTSGVRR